MLTEAIVATALLTTILVALAQLFAMSLAAIDAAKSTTLASVVAEQKLGQLRASSWETVAGNPGSVDYLDEHGQLLVSGGEAPVGAMYVRTSTSTRLPGHPDESVVIAVRVRRVGAQGSAHLIGVRTRRAE